MPILNNSPSDILRYLIIDITEGSLPVAGKLYAPTDWPVFNDVEPPLPDNCITTFDTTGTDDGRIMLTGEIVHHTGFQIRVRAQDKETGWLKANAIQISLMESVRRVSLTINTRTYLIHCIAKMGDILSLGKESPTSKRNLFTLNAVMMVEQVS